MQCVLLNVSCQRQVYRIASWQQGQFFQQHIQTMLSKYGSTHGQNRYPKWQEMFSQHVSLETHPLVLLFRLHLYLLVACGGSVSDVTLISNVTERTTRFFRPNFQSS